MIKKLLFVSLLTSGAALGQITVTQYDLIEPTDVVEQAYDQSLSITHTSAGTDQTWNYSALVEDSSGVFNVGAPGWANGSSEFPDATLSGNDGSGSGDLFMRKTSSALDFLGLYGDPVQSGTDEAYHFDPQSRITPLPLTYGTTDQNNYVFDITFDPGQGADSIRSKQSVEQNFEADAWGELTTPLGTFEVVRLSQMEISTDSTWAYFMGNAQLVDNSKDTTYSYSFYTNDQSARFPLVDYNYDPQAQQIVGDITWLKAQPTSSIKEEEASTFSVYPNPVSNNLFIEIKESGARYVILDVSGKEVMSGKVTGNQIDTSALKRGAYLIKITSKGNQVGTKKFMKK